MLLRKVLSHKECVVLCILKRKACTSCYRSQWVVCHVERNVDLLAETLCETSEERTATGEMDTVLYDVRVKLRRSLLEYVEDTALDTRNRLVKAV